MALAVTAEVKPAGAGAAARVAATLAPHLGSTAPGAAVTGRFRVSIASSGTQTSLQTRKAACALKVTPWPGLAPAGAVRATGSRTSPVKP